MIGSRLASLLVAAAACASEAEPAARMATVSLERQTEGTAFRGEILFHESFDDDRFESRGWYDSSSPVRLSRPADAPAGAVLECRLPRGATGCADGRPGRVRFDPQESLYLSYWVKYSEDWTGSGRPYHPHEFYFMTDRDDRYVGPAYTYFTLYVEQVDLRPRIAFQDARMVDGRCVLLNDDSVRGCGGRGVDGFHFGLDRSAAACNGVAGPVQGRDCYPLGDDRWYSMRYWSSDSADFVRPAIETGRWHLVEMYVRLNTVTGGRAVPDGTVRLWVDGRRAIAVDSLVFRMGSNGGVRLDQLLFSPYIGDGSPADQTIWIDEVTIASGRATT